MRTRARRSRRPTVLLLLLCLGLGYAVYAELGSGPADPADLTVTKVAPEPAAVAPAEPAFTLPPLGDFSETVARPLFLPSRRPLAPAEDAPAEAVTRDLFTLMGVIISADERMALVKRRKTGEVLRLIEGQRVDGWLVEAIMPDRLALSHGEETEEVVLKDVARPPRKKGRDADRSKGRTAKPPPSPTQKAHAGKTEGKSKPKCGAARGGAGFRL